MSEPKMYRERRVSIQDPKAFIVKEGDEWKLQLSDGTDVLLPESLGRSAYVALHVWSRHLTEKRGELRSRRFERKSRNSTEAYLKRFDCHALVAIGIGALTNLKFLDDLSYTAHHLFFDDRDFKTCSTRSEFETAFAPLFHGEPPIAVIQQKEHGSLSHSFFLIQGRSDFFVFYRDGRTGRVTLKKLDDAEWNDLVVAYGPAFAGDSYFNVAARQDLKEYYARPHWSD